MQEDSTYEYSSTFYSSFLAQPDIITYLCFRQQTYCITNNYVYEKTSNSFTTTLGAETTEEFKIIVLLSMLKKIPNGDFKVDVYKSKKGSKVLVFTSKNIESLEIILSVKE